MKKDKMPILKLGSCRLYLDMIEIINAHGVKAISILQLNLLGAHVLQCPVCRKCLKKSMMELYAEYMGENEID